MKTTDPIVSNAQLRFLSGLKQQAHDQLRLYLDLDSNRFKKLLDEAGIDHHHASKTMRLAMLVGDKILEEKGKNHPLLIRYYVDNLSSNRKSLL